MREEEGTDAAALTARRKMVEMMEARIVVVKTVVCQRQSFQMSGTGR
jgi:hypothetical protein